MLSKTLLAIINEEDGIDALLKRLQLEQFSLTDRTEEGDSIFHVLIKSNIAGESNSKNLSKHSELLLDLLSLEDINPNIKNEQGQTPLAYLLYSGANLEVNPWLSFIFHSKFDLNEVDEEGNGYLHLAMKLEKDRRKQIVPKLLANDINYRLKNKAGKIATELVPPKNGFEEDLLIEWYISYPGMALEKDYQGKSILVSMLKEEVNYSTYDRFNELFNACKTLPSGEEKLQEALHDCFMAYRQNQLSELTMNYLTKAIATSKTMIDVEYSLALTALSPAKDSFYIRKIFTHLTSLQPQIDMEKVINHIKQLSQENSAEQLDAIDNIGQYAISRTAYDQASIDLVTQGYKRKLTTANRTKLFGHLFSLSAAIPLDGSTLTLEAGSTPNALVFMAYLMNAYLIDCQKKNKYPDHIDAIRKVRDLSVKALRFEYLSYTWVDDKSFDPLIVETQGQVLEIATGWSGHAINIVFRGNEMYRNNGGGCSVDTTTEQYHIGKPENLTGSVFAKLYSDKSKESNKTYIQRDIHELLGLQYKGAIEGKFQTVGNCTFESLRIALKVKYRLFVPVAIADEIYEDTLKFFEVFYLEEFIKEFATSPQLPQVLLRLIMQKLIPEKNFELARRLLKDHCTSEVDQEMVQMELMLSQWKRKIAGSPEEAFNESLQGLGISLNPALNLRTQLLDRFLNNKSTAGDIAELKSWPADKQLFQGYHPLLFAVMHDDIALAGALVAEFPHAVNQANWYNEIPLGLVKSVAMIDLLVKAGAKTDNVQEDNPIDYAIRANRVDLVKALLKHGVKPSNMSGYYAGSKDPQLLILLHQHYPESLTAQTHSQMTAIHAAAASGQVDNLRTAIYYGGANVNAGDVNGTTPLQLALRKKQAGTAEVLMNNPNTLFHPTHRGDKVAVEGELKNKITAKEQEKNEDMNYYKTFKKSDPGRANQEIDYLIIALRNNDIRAIRGFLLTNPTMKVYENSDLYCTSPLANAILNLRGIKPQEYKDRLAIVKLLLETKSMDLNADTFTSEPLIFMATSTDNVDVLELFLADYRLNPNKQDSVGYTALHDAAERGHINCVRRLLQDERVDSKIENKKHKTAAELDSLGDFACRDEIVAHQQRKQFKIQ